MAIKPLFFLSFLFLITACKKEQENNVSSQIEQNIHHEVSRNDIEALDYTEYIIDSKADKLIQDWSEYIQIQEVISSVKTGDLSFFNDNKKAIKQLLKELKSNIPEALKTASIEARILVFETKLYQLESLSNLSTTSKEELLSTIKEFLVAFSNLSLQINKKIEFDTQVIEKP
ncbi:hypothetical protein [Cognatitamlana onchidii]|uniref:hypothetical protein n=1 Tax=Cognatitamlana onchidii TaxID=2562860 RepID=UPI0010A5FE73|nr:hypothetical protein [Algibacter onchidii]